MSYFYHSNARNYLYADTMLPAHRKKNPTYDEPTVVETYTADCNNVS